MVAEQRALELEKLVQSKYQDTRIYPKVVAVVSVSIMKRGSNSIDRLRRLIYEVSCRLQLSSDGASCRLLCGDPICGGHYLDWLNFLYSGVQKKHGRR